MSVMKGDDLDFWSYNAEQTRRFGSHLGALVEPGDVILLSGALGAGKTHFAQGIAQGMGITEPVRSPTFTLINEYHEGRLPLYHVDLYRLESEAALATIGLEELWDSGGVLVVEWPERGRHWLPDDALNVSLHHQDERRRTLRMNATQPRAQQLLRAYRRRAFAAPQDGR